jgi:hypothetical protein
MVMTEQQRLRRPSATLTLRRVPPDIVVLAEADIPADFFVPQPPPPPKLDKAALKTALQIQAEKLAEISVISDPQARRQAHASLSTISGAVLGNGGFSLQIRRS